MQTLHSEVGLGSTWVNLIDGQIISSGVVVTDSAWVSDRLVEVSVRGLVLKQVLNISVGEFSVETSLHVGDFSGNDNIIIVEGGLVEESFIEHTFEEQVEVGHESCVITVLVLLEDRLQSKVNLVLGVLLNGVVSETESKLKTSEEGDTPKVGHDTGLVYIISQWLRVLTPEYDFPILFMKPIWKAVTLGTLAFFWNWSNQRL